MSAVGVIWKAFLELPVDLYLDYYTWIHFVIQITADLKRYSFYTMYLCKFNVTNEK